MPSGYRIEFEPGGVIEPEFSPDNELVAINIRSEAFERLQRQVGGDAGLELPDDPEAFHAWLDQLIQRIEDEGRVPPAVIAPALHSIAGRVESEQMARHIREAASRQARGPGAPRW